ncbi:MAG: hypothetical protein WBM50_05485 [Acidimicrobiales bacterium]
MTFLVILLGAVMVAAAIADLVNTLVTTTRTGRFWLTAWSTGEPGGSCAGLLPPCRPIRHGRPCSASALLSVLILLATWVGVAGGDGRGC